MKQFSSEVISKLKYYVYLISDPSNGEIFSLSLLVLVFA